jgi:hypothetical protein
MLLDDAVATRPVPAAWLGTSPDLRGYAGSRDGTGLPLSASLDLGPVLPLPPCHLSAVRDGGGDVHLGWVRRSRADADGWAPAEVPLENVPEAYVVSILDGAAVVRTIDVGMPAVTYAATEQIADFGSLPVSFGFRVAQLSPVYGPGHHAEGSFNG